MALTVLIGPAWGLGLMVVTKYDFPLEEEQVKAMVKRLTNQLWKLIPMRENKENWRKQVDSIVIEIAGLNEIFNQVPQFLLLLSKLEGLNKVETTFEIYRKTVFECITLLHEINR